MRTLFRTLLALALGLSPLVLTQLLSAPVTSAQGATPAFALIVLDASGSMAAPGPGGARLIDQARTAVNGTVAALPAGSQVGLRVYGSQVSSDEAQKVVPISDVEYPVRVAANVAPFVAKTTATSTPSATPTAADAAAPTPSSGMSPWVWVAVGVLLLGGALVIMIVVLAKRNRASGPPPANPRL